MNPIYRYLSIFALAVISFSISQRVALGERIIEVSNVEELRVAQKFVGSSRAEGAESVTIKIAPGFYEIDESFRINRSNVSLVGESKVMFLLASNANQPMIAVGTQNE